MVESQAHSEVVPGPLKQKESRPQALAGVDPGPLTSRALQMDHLDTVKLVVAQQLRWGQAGDTQQLWGASAALAWTQYS